MSLILDAGALVAAERGSRDLDALVAYELGAGRVPKTHGGVVGQVWRGGARQARLARLFPAIDVVALDETLGRRAGELLARVTTLDDVVDAAVVLLADDGDTIVTSDLGDLALLAEAAGLEIDIVSI